MNKRAIFWGAVLVVAGGIFAVSLTMKANAAREEKENTCVQNLKNFKVWMDIYAQHHPQHQLPAATGSAFFPAFKEYIGKEYTDEFLTCPFGGKYRGPARDINAKDYQPTDAVCCDAPSSHSKGINVLYRDGRVVFVPKDTVDYKKALEQTKE
jgi:hypothetical protein